MDIARQCRGKRPTHATDIGRRLAIWICIIGYTKITKSDTSVRFENIHIPRSTFCLFCVAQNTSIGKCYFTCLCIYNWPYRNFCFIVCESRKYNFRVFSNGVSGSRKKISTTSGTARGRRERDHAHARARVHRWFPREMERTFCRVSPSKSDEYCIVVVERAAGATS